MYDKKSKERIDYLSICKYVFTYIGKKKLGIVLQRTVMSTFQYFQVCLKIFDLILCIWVFYLHIC